MSSFFTQLFNSNSNLKASLTEEDGIKSHHSLILDHLGRDSFQFEAHGSEKGYFKLLYTSTASNSINNKLTNYFKQLSHYEKWHLTKEGSIYAYQKNARQCIYRTGRKPTIYSDVADQLPERDNVQIQIINRLGSSSYAFIAPNFMCLCKFPSQSGTCDIEFEEVQWKSKEYHRFYLEDDGSIVAGHGSAKEMVLDKYFKPVNTMEGVLKKEAETLLTIRNFLKSNYEVKNEKILQYSYDIPSYRLTFLGLIPSIATYEDLLIIREEVYGKAPQHQNPVKLVNANGLPTLEFNPMPYLAVVFVVLFLVLSFVSKLRSSKNTAILLILGVSAYLTSSVNSMAVIRQNLLEQQKKYKEEEKKRQQGQPFSITNKIMQTVVNYAEKMLWEVWLESCQVEEWNLYAVKFIFITHTKLPPKQMTWIVVFGQVFLVNASSD